MAKCVNMKSSESLKLKKTTVLSFAQVLENVAYAQSNQLQCTFSDPVLKRQYYEVIQMPPNFQLSYWAGLTPWNGKKFNSSWWIADREKPCHLHLVTKSFPFPSSALAPWVTVKSHKLFGCEQKLSPWKTGCVIQCPRCTERPSRDNQWETWDYG